MFQVGFETTKNISCAKAKANNDVKMFFIYPIFPIMYMHLINYRCILNSLAPGKFEWNFRYINFKPILVIVGWDISCEIALIWMLLDFTDDHLIWFR